MRIIAMRHAKAEDKKEGVKDFGRPITEEGMRLMLSVMLQRLPESPFTIVSPAPRALMTMTFYMAKKNITSYAIAPSLYWMGEDWNNVLAASEKISSNETPSAVEMSAFKKYGENVETEVASLISLAPEWKKNILIVGHWPLLNAWLWALTDKWSLSETQRDAIFSIKIAECGYIEVNTENKTFALHNP